MVDYTESLLSEPPDNDYECYVCGKEIPTGRGVEPPEGEEYALMRLNKPSDGYIHTERYIHRNCLTEYLEQSE